MKWKLLLMILLVIVSLVPAYYVNQKLQAWVQPRQSFGRLISYFLLMMLFVFAYTFLVVLLILQLFPAS